MDLISPAVLEQHGLLLGCIDGLAQLVDRIISDNESNFLYAYRVHLQKITRELEEIRSKSQAQEKFFSVDNRISFLEKQVTIFRDQALRSHKQLEDLKVELDVSRQQAALLQAEVAGLNQQLKKYIKGNKELASELSRVNLRNAELAEEGESARASFSQVEAKLKQLEEKRADSPIKSMESERQNKVPLKVRAQVRKEVDRRMCSSEMQQLFWQSIQLVQKDILKRRGLQEKTLKKEQFLQTDRKKLVDTFLTNQKVIHCLYQSTFGTTIEKEQEEPDEQEGENSVKGLQLIEQDYRPPQIPKPRVKKVREQIRGKVRMQKGQLKYL